jgi:malonyl-ACP decarboxylase
MSGPTRVALTGMGVITSIGRDLASFAAGLRHGACGISWLRRISTARIPVKIGAEIRNWNWRDSLAAVPWAGKSLGARGQRILNRAPESTRLSACAAAQALAQSGLLASPPEAERIGLVVAGSNLHQQYIHENSGRFREEPQYINPTYAIYFLDTSQVGCLSELFDLRGLGYTAGGSSASGNVALYHAWQWIRTGILDACVVVGASADFSAVELQAFSILGAACSEPYRTPPEQACRPFDRDRAGFVLGEGSACVVLENFDSARQRGAGLLGELKGASLALDGNSLANPVLEGEIKAMRIALREAGADPADIGYINAHGTSSVLGDQVESEALCSVFGEHPAGAPVNSTKSLTGHCMFAAGIIEFIACAIQLNEGFLHPNLNLANPLDSDLHFAGPAAQPLRASLALSNGFGFGGFNSSLVFGKVEPDLGARSASAA